MTDSSIETTSPRKRLKIERRVNPKASWTLLMYLAAIVIGFTLTALLLATSGADIIKAFTALFKGAFGSEKAILATLAKSTPLILTGLATVVAFQAQVWSIGQEGQVYAGAMGAYFACLIFAGLPVWIYLTLIVLSGMIGGAVLGGVSAILKDRFDVNEIISTVMMNYLIVFLLSYLIGGGPWTEVSTTVVYQQTGPVPEASQLPHLLGSTKLHLGFVFAILSAIVCFILLEKTPLGYEIRAMGFNPIALAYRGTNIGRTTILVMVISGAIAGIAGVSEIFGTSHRLRADTLYNLGYTGIIIGMIGGLRPLGTVVAGIAFGGLASGALYMKLLAQVPAALVPAMQGIMLLTFLCAAVAARYKIVRIKSDG
jgi:general nucleoside transport system permease protein